MGSTEATRQDRVVQGHVKVLTFLEADQILEVVQGLSGQMVTQEVAVVHIDQLGPLQEAEVLPGMYDHQVAQGAARGTADHQAPRREVVQDLSDLRVLLQEAQEP